MNEKKGLRQSNLELLRILAMCMIITCHFVTYNDFGPTNVFSDKILALSVLRLGGKLGVVLFVMITVYFMLNKEFKWARILDLSKQTLFFSVVMAVLAYSFAGFKPVLLDILKMLFPLVLGNYWFPTDFAIVLILSPILNTVIQSTDKKILTIGLVGLIVLVGFPIVTPDMKNSIVGLVLAYMLGAYIRKFDLKMANVKLIIALILAVVLTIAITGLLITASETSAFISSFRLFFVTGFNISAFLVAFLVFMLFIQWNIGYIKVINFVASTTFGVYLFHDNRSFRIYMWHELIDPTRWQGANLILGLLVSVVIIFLFGMFLEIIRRSLSKGALTLVGLVKGLYRKRNIEVSKVV